MKSARNTAKYANKLISTRSNKRGMILKQATATLPLLLFSILILNTSCLHGMQEDNDKNNLPSKAEHHSASLPEHVMQEPAWRVIHPPEDLIWLLHAQAHQERDAHKLKAIADVFRQTRWGD